MSTIYASERSYRARGKSNQLLKFKITKSVMALFILAALCVCVRFAGFDSAISAWDSPLGLGLTVAVLVVLLGSVTAALSRR